MKDSIDINDESKQSEIDKFKEEKSKKSGFMKLLEYNKPRIYIFTAIFASAIDGSI